MSVYTRLLRLPAVFFLLAMAPFIAGAQAGIVTGRLANSELDEISGIAASALHPGLLYVHNDSGDTSRFFAIGPDGLLRFSVYFKGVETGRGVRDCEDMVVGPGEPGRTKTGAAKSYIYIGDIGDNQGVRKCITIYRLEEPELPADPSDTVLFSKSAAIRLVYPDGPRDAETLMIDPMEKLLYIVSKREDSVRIYTAPWVFRQKNGVAGDTVTLKKRTTLFLPGSKPSKYITAGDISADGQQVLLKSYTQVFYWKRKGHEPIWQLLQTPPRQLPYTPEKQGEAIGFTHDGKGYYTTSEGVNAPIYYYPVKE